MKTQRRKSTFDMAKWQRYRDAAPESAEKRKLRDELIFENIGLVRLAVKRQMRLFHSDAPDESEFMTAGLMGLAQALDKLDPVRGKFSTIAVIWIKKMMLTQLKDAEIVRHPDRHRMPHAVSKVFAKYWSKHGRHPTLEELKLEVSEGYQRYNALTEYSVRRMVEHTWFHDSLDSTTTDAHDVEFRTTAGDRIPDVKSSAEQKLIDEVNEGIIARARQLLTDEERFVIQQAVYEDRPLEKVAVNLQKRRREGGRPTATCSKQSVMRIRNAALTKFREALEEES